MLVKIKHWRQKLLDTGKRNKLLNFKETKRSTLKIIKPDIENLWNEIQAGKQLKFPLIDENDNTEFQQVKTKKYEKNTIDGGKKGSELYKTLGNLKSKSKTALEELGINILYLAFGFLEWTEIEYSKEVLQSPLILVPVEISRESIQSPFCISIFEDDIVLNPTLCFKLENDFGLKLEYEIDSDNFSLNEFFEYISSQVINLKWKVNRDVQLCPFSFLKLNMYKDLEINEEKIIENEIIKALCGEQSDIEKIPDEFLEVQNLDNLVNPIETYQVIDADSSQQQAILAAKKGISFVLQGPPGTGKSQTITNIIAECLAVGKKVLFVSEKMAALEVVYRNLHEVKLEDFCLQLHSHKANKKVVIKDLIETMKKAKTQVDENHLDDLDTLKNETLFLNEFSVQIHSIRQPLGKSVYQVQGELDKNYNFPNIRFKPSKFEETSTKSLRETVSLLDSYITSLIKIGEDYKDNCFYGYIKKRNSFEIQNDFLLQVKELTSKLESIYLIFCRVNELFTLGGCNNIDSIKNLVMSLDVMANWPNCPNEWLIKPNFEDITLRFVSNYKKHQILCEKENEIFTDYKEEILTLRTNDLLERFTNNYKSPLRFFQTTYRNDRKILRNFQKFPKKRYSFKSILNSIKTINYVQSIKSEFNENESQLIDWFDGFYKSRLTDWKYISDAISWITRIKEIYNGVLLDEKLAGSLCQEKSVMIIKDFCSQLSLLDIEVNEETNSLEDYYDFNLFDFRKEPIEKIISKLQKTQYNFELLPDWVDFINLREECNNHGFSEFFFEMETINVSANNYIGTYLKRFYSLWLDEIYLQNKLLSEFNREKFERLRKDFQEKDINQFVLARARIRQILSSQRPNVSNLLVRGTEVNTLIRESQKQRKIMPVRVLFEKIPNLLLTIKPCLLMSPLSVSQYLNPVLYSFDTVIFDEASQVCTENAIGAIYRSRQVIIVGDREQLPPTNFFNASISDDEYDYDNEEIPNNDIDAYESVLDEFSSILTPLQLRWHYRSQQESLIAFSNAKIYKNLITFPAPIIEEHNLGVEFIHVVNGVYDRSVSRTNRIEAHKVAELVLDHFKKYPERSLGVVTFSEAQQEAIENELFSLRKQNSTFEAFFDDEKKEHFFIKNLENVQGDERDTIIISIGYGKDQNNKLSMFFGPLNHKGGYRRLNVAITRARMNLKLVSSLLPTEIDLSRTESIGIIMLKSYLDFAQRGIVALNEELIISEKNTFDSPFEMQVFDVLTDLGYDVSTQVGCSGYRIDLAVKHPTEKGKYVIGIECDGANYHSAQTARERDRLREDVLRNRGWNIYRIWSTDWIRHRASEIDRLINAIENAINNDRLNITSPQEPIITNSIDLLENIDTNNKEKLIIDRYIRANINDISRGKYPSDESYLADLICHIVNIESPIHFEVVCRYLAPLFGNLRVTKVITRSIDYVIKNYCKNRVVVKGDFLWSPSMKKPVFRKPEIGFTPREINQISPEEIAEGMKAIIETSIGIEKQALFQRIAWTLGFNRTGEKILTSLEFAFNFLIQKEEILVKGENISIKIKT